MNGWHSVTCTTAGRHRQHQWWANGRHKHLCGQDHWASPSKDIIFRQSEILSQYWQSVLQHHENVSRVQSLYKPIKSFTGQSELFFQSMMASFCYFICFNEWCPHQAAQELSKCGEMQGTKLPNMHQRANKFHWTINSNRFSRGFGRTWGLICMSWSGKHTFLVVDYYSCYV